MQNVIKAYLDQFKIGRKQSYKNLTVFPLLSTYSLDLNYLLLDEALAEVTVDLSGRPFLVYDVRCRAKTIKNFEVALVPEFLRALSVSAGTNLHVALRYGRNSHHILEAVFKAVGRAFGAAVRIDTRIKGVLSTKGRLSD